MQGSEQDVRCEIQDTCTIVKLIFHWKFSFLITIDNFLDNFKMMTLNITTIRACGRCWFNEHKTNYNLKQLCTQQDQHIYTFIITHLHRWNIDHSKTSKNEHNTHTHTHSHTYIQVQHIWDIYKSYTNRQLVCITDNVEIHEHLLHRWSTESTQHCTFTQYRE